MDKNCQGDEGLQCGGFTVMIDGALEEVSSYVDSQHTIIGDNESTIGTKKR